MDSQPLGLGAYAGTFARYKPWIRASSSVEEASTLAARFLSEVDGLVHGHIDRVFYQEASHIWSGFPTQARTLPKYQEVVEVLLGQAVDFYWYGDYPQYRSDRDVDEDKTLCSFRRFSSDFDVKFTYVQYYGHLMMRIPNSLRLRYRRLTNHPGKYTQGLTTTRCKKAMAGLINQVAVDSTARIQRNRPFRVLVNSVLRTVEYQNALASIGYVAPRHSAHLAGYAVDVEKLWYEENDREAFEAMEDTLKELLRTETINLIEEATHWHVSLNPDHIPAYESVAQQWIRKRR
jgi:hypothetical protein